MPSVFLFGSATRARIKEKTNRGVSGYERELSDHSVSIGMSDSGQTVPIAMCVFLASSRATVFFGPGRTAVPFAAVQMGVLGRTLNCPHMWFHRCT